MKISVYFRSNFNIMRQVIFIVFIILTVSCGTQRKLQKAFIGERSSILKEQFGDPKTILDQGDEKVYVYEKIEELRSTEINQAQLTLDPIITPKVTKTERCYFYVKDGKIVKVKMDEEYER